MISLKSCPACGSNACGFNFRRAGRSTNDLYRVLCVGCGMATSMHDSPELAAEVWNCRESNTNVVAVDPEVLVSRLKVKTKVKEATPDVESSLLRKKWV